MTPARDHLAWLVWIAAALFATFIIWALVWADQPATDAELRRDVITHVCPHDERPGSCAIVLWEGQ